MMKKPDSKKTVSPLVSADKIKELETQVQQLKEQQLRAQADYQNLVRRNQTDRAKLVKLATADLMANLLEHFDHLEMAAGQLQDPGLSMVIGQLQKVLQEYGLVEIEVLGRQFDVDTMEAVEKKGEGNKVVAVHSRGYRLNGEVLRHAKVIIG